MTYPPLQTHGITEERWIPPTKEPFIRYEKSDEEWCRYCRIGKVVDELVGLYDVHPIQARSPSTGYGYPLLEGNPLFMG